MSSEAKAVADRFRVHLDRQPPDLAGGRRSYRQLAAGFELAADIQHELAVIGGVNVEYVRAPNSRAEAVLIYVHGGGYVSGDAAAYRHLVAEAARASATTGVALDYRLAPEAPFPAAIDDLVVVYGAIVDAGQSPAGIVLAGDSAGGGLVLAALLTMRDLGLPMPAAAWLISPFCDLARDNETARLKATVDPIALTPQKSAALAALYLGSASIRDPRASPVHANLEAMPPLRIDVGSHETLLDDALTIARNAALKDVDVTLQVWSGMVHIFPYFAPILQQGRAAIEAAGAFLRAHLSDGGPATNGPSS